MTSITCCREDHLCTNPISRRSATRSPSPRCARRWPLLVLFVLLGVLRITVWKASLAALVMALVVAVGAYSMPFDQALLAGSQGAVFGFFPILWIVINAIWT